MRLLHSSTSCAAGFAVAVLMPVILSGCSRQPGLVGKWAGSAPASTTSAGGTVAYSYDFHGDGLVEMSAKADKSASLINSPMASMLLGTVANVHSVGSYTVKDDVLTISPKSMTLLDDKGQAPMLTPTVSKDPQVIRYKLNGATLTLDRMDGDKPLVLTRQKDANDH